MSPPLSDAQATRVERHTELVRATARRVSRRVGDRHISVEELESVGNEALVRAAMRYDPEAGASFATYAYYRVHGAMIDALRKRTPGVRRRKQALIRLSTTQALLEQAAEDQAAQRAAGQRLTLEQRVEAARELVRKASVAVRLSEPAPQGFERIAADDPDPEAALLDVDRRRQLWALVAELDDHERDLVEALYEQGLTMRSYAEQIGTSVATVSRRHARIVGLLGKRIAARERGRV